MTFFMSASEGGGLPLYDTLQMAFPEGLVMQGMEVSIQCKVRRRLRQTGYKVHFPTPEWTRVVEYFAIAALERLHRAYGGQPWFWVVQWPNVLGAAAAEFWPQVGTAIERRAVAMEAGAAHLEALLLSTALAEDEGTLPRPAVLALEALGQTFLPALPAVDLNELGLGAFDFTRPDFGLVTEVSDLEKPPPPPRPDTSSSSLPAAGEMYKQVDSVDEGGSTGSAVSGVSTTSGGSGVSSKASVSQVQSQSTGHNQVCKRCDECSGELQRHSRADEVYTQSLAVCDSCYEPCGLESLQAGAEPGEQLDPSVTFWHCHRCKFDLCEACASDEKW
mmetsp:Transcript_56361/g.104272  ORF Transcript_56361/g.104272 Transcript_56361/m.104272 type:complete len:332 (+) Transcript_56361:157-1152(+)